VDLGFVASGGKENLKGRRVTKFIDLVNLSKSTNFHPGDAHFLTDRRGGGGAPIPRL